jgi:hypothetical protein
MLSGDVTLSANENGVTVSEPTVFSFLYPPPIFERIIEITALFKVIKFASGDRYSKETERNLEANKNTDISVQEVRVTMAKIDKQMARLEATAKFNESKAGGPVSRESLQNRMSF